MGLTAERLREVAVYDPATGGWSRPIRVDSRGRKCGGQKLGCDKDGYVVIRIDYVLYRAVRLAFLYMTGAWPIGEVDHRNTIRNDDRWNNLRDATQGLNNANRYKYKNNKVGIKGVVFDKARHRYKAQITVGGKTRWICNSSCPAAAAFAYQIEADKAFGSYHRAL